MPGMMYDCVGQRKYLTKTEREGFLEAAKHKSDAVRTFCWMIAATGCRISEALALTGKNVDFEARQVIIECLKKRGKQVFRAIPLPSELLADLRALINSNIHSGDRLWPWSRMTGYRRILEVMQQAGISGPQATPKGLRHGFGVCAIQSQVPLNMIQRWLGHADIKTTAIYTSAMGPEEREIASRMWGEGLKNIEPEKRSARRKVKRINACPTIKVLHEKKGLNLENAHTTIPLVSKEHPPSGSDGTANKKTPALDRKGCNIKGLLPFDTELVILYQLIIDRRHWLSPAWQATLSLLTSPSESKIRKAFLKLCTKFSRRTSGRSRVWTQLIQHLIAKRWSMARKF